MQMMPKTFTHIFSAIVAAVALCSAAYGQAAKAFPDDWFFEGAARPAPLKALEGKPASAITATEWIGSAVTIKDQRGKVVVIDFWATWCGPCVASIPENVALVKKYAGKDLVFVGVHDASAGWENAAAVVKLRNINYPVARDKTGGIGVSAGEYKVQFWPTYIVIDRAGMIRAAGLMPNHVEDVVKVLLAELKPDGPTPGVAEFPAEMFNGGEARPAGLKAIEGKPAAAVRGDEWVGKAAANDMWKNSVVVLHFTAPGQTLSSLELEKVGALEKEFGSQGVMFVGVCDGRIGVDKLRDFVKAKSVTMPIMHDLVENAPKDGAVAKGQTAAAYGVKFFPCTIVIDRSGKVRAAGVKPEKIKPMIEKLLAEKGAATGGK